MNIDFNRVCKLAGIENTDTRNSLNESQDVALQAELSALEEENLEEQTLEEDALEEESLEETLDEDGHKVNTYMMPDDIMVDQGPEGEDYDFSAMSDSEMGEFDIDAGPLEETIEVDIHVLMQELRAAKKQLNENRDKRAMQETHLKRIIQQEVDNILEEIEWRDASWVYGDKQPKRSKKGHVAQGATIPGIGFK